MNHLEVGSYWNANAYAWTVLARAGHDVYRDLLNTPSFLAMLPDVRGQHGLDIGCGEGGNTRLVAERAGKMSAIDIASTFIDHARSAEQQNPLGIDYQVASVIDLPFPAEHFDFAVSFMCLMDVPETAQAIAEAYRVLKQGGFLQFSITHPCFNPPHRRNLRKDGVTYALEVGNYFGSMDGEIEEWIFGSAPLELRSQFPKFRVPRFHRTLSEWFNVLIQAGFMIEQIAEPKPSDEVVRECPYIQDAQVAAYFLQIRARKPVKT